MHDNPYLPPAAPSSASHPPPADADFQLASRWKRLFAQLADGLICGGVIWLAILFVLGFSFKEAAAAGIGTQVLFALLGAAVFLGINGLLLVRQGQTVGKRLLGIRIVDDQGRVPPATALLVKRFGLVWAVAHVPVAGNLLGLVDALFVFRSDRRCIHDLVAGTHVVEARPA